MTVRSLLCFALIGVLPAAACAQDAPSSPAQRVTALVDSGRLSEAAALAAQGGDALAAVRADVLVLQGRLDLADSLYRLAIARGLDARAAMAGRAEVAARRRNDAEAQRLAASLVREYESGATGWSARDRVAAGRAYVVAGAASADAIRSALAVFDAVSASGPREVESRLRAADLLLDKYNAPDAKSTYGEVLRILPGHPRAHAGLARAMSFEGDADAIKLVRTALAANPALVPARLHLARLHLEAEAYDSALSAASAALAVDSSATNAWGTLGAVAWLRGDTMAYRAAESAARRNDPRPADFYAEVAEAAARHRRYADAASIAAQGVAVDGSSSRALGVLGTNNLRIGKIAEGRAQLEQAFARDPYHVWNKNTLDLLDALAKFRVVDTGRFQFVAPAGEIDIVVAYLSPLLEAAYDTLAQRYAYRPPTPIRLEVYRSHADFSVRTVGLAGLGALGVSFGTVLAMDAPGARDPGTFNFGSTAWHELAHTFTLGASDNRVPRWISEGLSVLEERRARRGWGADVSLEFLGALKAGRILPVSRINEGLVRPSHPQEIGFSYYQASLVMEMIEGEKGIDGIRNILRGYREGRSTADVMQRVLRMTPDSLDRHFGAWLTRRFAQPLASIEPWDTKTPVGGAYVDAVGRGRSMMAAGNAEGARTELERAMAMMPQYGGPDAAAWPLAQLRAQQGDTAGAISAVAAVTTRSETALEPNLLEARLRLRRGDLAGAADALERAVWINPADLDAHRELASTSEQVRNFRVALRERRAIVALGAPDRADARYHVARLLMLSGDRAAARREILAVLEEAPAFEKAQELLLTLSGGS